MLHYFRLTSVLAGVLMATASWAQAPASAPAGSTGQCRDGSYWTGAVKRGACRGHKGVQDWYGGADAASGSAPAAAPAASPAAMATPAPASTAAASTAPASAAPATTAPASTAPATTAPATTAPGGGPGQVWVNSSSKVYHCPTDRWYGKTKKGEYMSESEAIAQGNRADHGKACAK